MTGVIDFLHNLPMLVKFSLLLICIYSFPRMMERIRLPGIIGLLLIGILLGPHGLEVMGRKTPVIDMFAELGKLLLMFFAGFEVDFEQFNKSRHKSLVFGILTFSLPLATGIFVARSFDYEWNASFLIGSIVASHTLIGFPIIKKLGLLSHESVVITIGATLLADVSAMLILAICLPIHVSGFSTRELLISIAELAIFIPFMLFAFSWLVRHAFKRFVDSKETNLIILLLLISIAALAAQLFHLEGIVGAFLAGLAVKRAMQKRKIGGTLDTISQTLFIPAFFIVTGFLINFREMFETIAHYPLLVLGIVGGLLAGKFLASYIVSRLYQYSSLERSLMTSLSIPQVASTLASTIVAYETFNADGARLIDEPILNTVLVTLIVTAVLGPILTSYYGEKIKSSIA